MQTIDNDLDHKIDYPVDPGCENRNDNDETDPPPPPPQCDDNADTTSTA